MNDDMIGLSTKTRFRAVGEEGVLVHLESARVLVVNEVGLHLVGELGRGATTVDRLAQSVVSRFEVEFEQARRDVGDFLEQLRNEQAVVAVESSAGASG